MKAEIRPATAQDVLALNGRIPWRLRAFAAERDGHLLGVGGFAFQPDGLVVAFLILAEGVTGRNAMVTLHKAGLKSMKLAKDLGLRCVVANADTKYPAAERWLTRLGFKPVKGAWVWKGD